MSSDGSPTLVVGTDAEVVGRRVRAVLDEGGRVHAFVGDLDADRAAVSAFVADVARDSALGR